jgi:chromosome segregation ATPase
MNEEQQGELEQRMTEIVQIQDDIKYAVQRWNDAKNATDDAVTQANEIREETNEELTNSCEEGNTLLKDLQSYISSNFRIEELSEDDDLWKLHITLRRNQEFAQYPDTIEDDLEFEAPHDLDQEDYFAIDNALDLLSNISKADLKPELSLESLQKDFLQTINKVKQLLFDELTELRTEFHNDKISNRLIHERLDTQASLIETLEDTIATQKKTISDWESNFNAQCHRLDKQDTKIQIAEERLNHAWQTIGKHSDKLDAQTSLIAFLTKKMEETE